MFLQRSPTALRRQLQTSRVMVRMAAGRVTAVARPVRSRWFSESPRVWAVKPVLLADIGEGIVECEVIQWFVEPGARVEEFSPLCEVQSDKASVEITSRFTGTVQKLYYDAGEMAKVGKPFVDIDIEGDAEPETPPPSLLSAEQQRQSAQSSSSSSSSPAQSGNDTAQRPGENGDARPAKPKGKMASLATPAVRHLSKTLDIDIIEIDGSGRDGRVLKEDIYRFVKDRDQGGGGGGAGDGCVETLAATPSSAAPPPPGVQVETRTPLTPMQHMMFKSMTRSLSIPHFLYTDEVNFTELVALRTRLNKVLSKTAGAAHETAQQPDKLSYLPFIIKAVSMALHQFPILNSRVEIDQGSGKPHIVMRSQHNIGVAMDTPQGLLVPVVRDVASRNILSIAAELLRLQALARAGKISPDDMRGGTITVSNIGSIGGTYLSPVIVEKEVAILGIGRMRTVPAFDDDGKGDRIVKRHVTNFSWSADHRVVDGATMARAAEVVRRVVEEPDVMVMHLR